MHIYSTNFDHEIDKGNSCSLSITTAAELEATRPTGGHRARAGHVTTKGRNAPDLNLKNQAEQRLIAQFQVVLRVVTSALVPRIGASAT